MAYLNAKPKTSLIASLILQSLVSTSVFSAGFQLNEISPGLQGDATAGAGAAFNDVSSLFFNPATLATLQGTSQGYAGGSVIIPNETMTNARAIHTVNVPGIPPSSITAPVSGKNFQGRISPSIFVPDGYFGYRINDSLVAGIAVTAPFGLQTSYSDQSVVRFASLFNEVKTVNINPALAYTINDKWAVGAGFQAQFMQATLSNFNGPHTDIPPIDHLIAANHPTRLRANSWGYGYTLGVLFKPITNARLGLGFRSEISERLKGHGQQYLVPGNTVPAPSQNFPFNAQTSVSAPVKTPQVLTLSGAYDLPLWTIKASAQLNFWDVFDKIDIHMPEAFATENILQTHWKNSWFGALGAEFHNSPFWTFRAGIAYDETPTQHRFRDTRIPDSDRFWLTFGTTYKVNENISIDGAYGHIFFKDQSIDVVQSGGSSATSTLPLEVNKVYADYSGTVDIIAIAFRYKV